MYELKQEIERAKIDKEQDELKAHTDLSVKVEKAKEKASVLITKAKGQQQIAVNEVRAWTVQEINKAKTASQKLQINTDQQVAVMSINAQTEKTAEAAKYQALIQECAAEQSNIEALNAQREHEYELAKGVAYGELSGGRTKIVMSGESGEQLIQKIFDLN